MRFFWEDKWIPADERYKEIQRPHLKADLILDGGTSDFGNGKLIIGSI
jgi:hypothetical protein